MFISDNQSFLTDCKSLVWWHLEKDFVFPNLHVQHDGNRKQLLVWMKFDSRSPDVFFIFHMKLKRDKREFFCDKVKWRTVPDLTSDLWPADSHSRRRQTDVCLHFVCRKLTDTRFTVFFLEKKTVAFCPKHIFQI